jgi:predicted enzyme related to lactoylglutathione lyase
MMQKISHVSLLVADQQEALDWYTQKLGWVMKSNDPFPGEPENRWITVAPAGQTEMEVVLQPPAWGPGGDENERRAQIGKAPGFVLVTDDCNGDCEAMVAKGVEVIDAPKELPWGISALFVDLYGYVHNLLQPFEG